MRKEEETPEILKNYILVSLVVISFAGVLFLPPVPQPLIFHNFADARILFKIPNFFNSFSNIFFLAVGAAGFLTAMKLKHGAVYSWRCAFLGLVLTSFGSFYYHLNPNNITLIFDRLPMAVLFAGLLTAVIAENINLSLDRKALYFILTYGIFSVVWWGVYDDLRFYLWLQIMTVLTLPVVFFFYRGGFPSRAYMIFAFLTYACASICEKMDNEIFSLTAGNLSGHTVKHILASAAVFWLILMLQKREKLFVVKKI